MSEADLGGHFFWRGMASLGVRYQHWIGFWRGCFLKRSLDCWVWCEALRGR